MFKPGDLIKLKPEKDISNWFGSDAIKAAQNPPCKVIKVSSGGLVTFENPTLNLREFVVAFEWFELWIEPNECHCPSLINGHYTNCTYPKKGQK